MLFLNKKNTGINVPQTLGSFLVVSLLCLAGMFFVDRSALILIHTNLPTAWSSFFNKITVIGEGDYWIAGSLCTTAACYLGKRFISDPVLNQLFKSISQKSLFIFVSIISSGLVLNIAKTAIGRLRPYYFLTENIYGFRPFNFDFGMNCFPSGHSQTIWAAMVSISILFPRLTIPSITVAILVASSRVFITAHYVSDVLMGSYLGMIITFFVYSIFTRKGLLKHEGET